MVFVTPISHQDPAITEQIGGVLRLASQQEIALMRTTEFVPTVRNLEDIVTDTANYMGAFVGNILAGVLSVRPDEEPGRQLISLLIVHPDHQRKRIATSLIHYVLDSCHVDSLTVYANSKNIPALALYLRLGFVPYRLGSINEHLPPFIKLIWTRSGFPTPLDNER